MSICPPDRLWLGQMRLYLTFSTTLDHWVHNCSCRSTNTVWQHVCSTIYSSHVSVCFRSSPSTAARGRDRQKSSVLTGWSSHQQTSLWSCSGHTFLSVTSCIPTRVHDLSVPTHCHVFFIEYTDFNDTTVVLLPQSNTSHTQNTKII